MQTDHQKQWLAIAHAGYFLQELNAFLTPDLESQMVVDRSAHGELLRINFNISLPSLPCEFASLDVSDALGTVGPQTACLFSVLSAGLEALVCFGPLPGAKADHQMVLYVVLYEQPSIFVATTLLPQPLPQVAAWLIIFLLRCCRKRST